VLEETGHDGTSYVHRELNPLVAQNSRRRNGYIVGRLLPKPPPPPRPNDDEDNNGTTTAGSVAVPALFVRFPAPAIQITMDRDPEHGQYRGYWFHGSDQCDAWYRLLRPYYIAHFLSARTALAATSWFVDRRHRVDPTKKVQDFVQNNPVLSRDDDLSILRLFREPLVPHLLQARDDITPRCALIRSVRNMTAATVDLPDELLEQYCTVIEGGLNQEPWGSPRSD
jgi:hypothetical protein